MEIEKIIQSYVTQNEIEVASQLKIEREEQESESKIAVANFAEKIEQHLCEEFKAAIDLKYECVVGSKVIPLLVINYKYCQINVVEFAERYKIVSAENLFDCKSVHPRQLEKEICLSMHEIDKQKHLIHVIVELPVEAACIKAAERLVAETLLGIKHQIRSTNVESA